MKELMKVELNLLGTGLSSEKMKESMIQAGGQGEEERMKMLMKVELRLLRTGLASENMKESVIRRGGGQGWS